MFIGMEDFFIYSKRRCKKKPECERLYGIIPPEKLIGELFLEKGGNINDENK